MAEGKSKISLNEIGFASSVFAGSTEMLRFCAGSRNAAKILYSGAMYSAQEALDMGLVDIITSPEKLMGEAVKIALELSEKSNPAFAGIKSLLRGPIAEEMKAREEDSIKKFVEIWYSNDTRENLKKIKIR
jgi:enoyl-CoA hydratase/carnithine racemase